MTIAQAKIFYQQDTKDYEIEKSKEFLTWLKNSVIDWYHSFISIKKLQELIDSIVNWYEIKYPERELENILKVQETWIFKILKVFLM